MTENQTKRVGRPEGSKASHPSDVVRRVRLALGKTQEEMAQDLECSISTLRRFEQKSLSPGSRAIKNRLTTLAKRAGVALDTEKELANIGADKQS